MNRPYYALAAMLAVLTGSAVAVSPVQVSSSTAQAALESRSLCGRDMQTHFVHTNVFVLVVEDASCDENDAVTGYDESCGYDANRGESFYEEEADWSPFPTDAGTFAESVEAWPTDERIDYGYEVFEEEQSVCGGDELDCPYFGGRAGYSHDVAEVDCGEGAEIADEAAFFEADDESWKTAPVETPDWIEDYVTGESAANDSLSIEQQYAEAELQAARDAGENLPYGPALAASPLPNHADYSDEYESLFALDAIVADDEEESEDESDDEESDEEGDSEEMDDDSPFSNLIGRLLRLFIISDFEEDAEEAYDSTLNMIEQWNDLAVQLTQALPVLPQEAYASQVQNDDRALAAHALPEEAAESREMLESIAVGLRRAGELLLTLADGIEAEAGRVLSAQHESGLAR